MGFLRPEDEKAARRQVGDEARPSAAAHEEQQQIEKRRQRDSRSSGDAEDRRAARKKRWPSALRPLLAASLVLFKTGQQKILKKSIKQESNKKVKMLSPLSYLVLWQLRLDASVPSWSPQPRKDTGAWGAGPGPSGR